MYKHDREKVGSSEGESENSRRADDHENRVIKPEPAPSTPLGNRSSIHMGVNQDLGLLCYTR